MKKPSLMDKFLKMILRSRFEPVETILALSAIMHGIWLIVPYWAVRGPVDITPAPRPAEMLVGFILFGLGAVHFTSITRRWYKARRHITFLKFIAWSFLAWLAYLAVGPDSIIWIGYLTIALISAVVYLNVGVRDEEW